MDKFQKQLTALRQWAVDASKDNWIQESDLQSIDTIEQQTADDLFLHGSQRPLVVALFGGTGAGKSSLLNRLAGEDIARTGVERPTSHEITLYLHQAYQLNALPTELPTEQVNIHYHNDDSRKLIAWLDMPDIDSTETSNRQLVETWLPYIDWLVYVVTPERYQDDIGWRFLQQRGERHHWLFVMNHWDEGAEEQIQDLHQRLQNEGFSQPDIIRTSCIQPPIADDFDKLEQIIQNALQQHGLEVLKKIGLQARMDDLDKLFKHYQSTLGTDSQWQTAKQSWKQLSAENLQPIKKALLTQADMVIQPLTKEESSGLKFWRRKKTVTQLPSPATISRQIWSPRIETLAIDLSRTLQSTLQSQQLPASPFSDRLSNWQKTISSPLQVLLQKEMEQSMVKPGSPARRFFWKSARWLSGVLPLAAAVWVVFHVVQRFHAGTQGLQDFLGSEFAIHSLLMIALGWFIPWLIQRQIQPSAAQAARQGLKSGVEKHTAQMQQELELIFEETDSKKNTVLKKIRDIQTS